MIYLQDINSPADLKKFNVEQLKEICKDLREFIIEQLSHNPGHLSSGTVELTVALHYLYTHHTILFGT